MYNLPHDSFFFVITTEFQAKLFKTFSVKIVCLDSTYWTSQYKHKLSTLAVLDEFNNGMYITLLQMHKSHRGHRKHTELNLLMKSRRTLFPSKMSTVLLGVKCVPHCPSPKCDQLRCNAHVWTLEMAILCNS